MIVQGGLRSGFAYFKLCTDLLQAGSKRFNLLLLLRHLVLKVFLQLRDGRLLFLYLAVFFKKLIEQHRVHRVVAYGVDLAVLVADYQVRIYLSYVLSNQPKLRSVCGGALVVKCHWLQRKNSFAGPVHRFNVLLKSARGTGRAELAGGVDQHWYCVAVSRCHPANVADKAAVAYVRTCDVVADADNVIRRGDGRARSSAQGRIIVSSAVTTQRRAATSRVIAASGVVKERSSAVSRIEVAGGVELERTKTGSRIFLAGGVGRQRVRAEGAVVGAIGIAQ